MDDDPPEFEILSDNVVLALVGFAVYGAVRFLTDGWLPDLIHLGVCQFVGPC